MTDNRPLYDMTDQAIHVMLGMAIHGVQTNDHRYVTGSITKIADELTTRGRWHRLLAQLPPELSQTLIEVETADRMAYLDSIAEQTHDPHPRVGLRRHLHAVSDNTEGSQR
ncbi:hypothetical protein SEA_LIGMA_59 [Gordonia phage Ligma]|nr:hypothetical protein SEA_LIGMA_59 [Gordonia phage Ligma]UQT02158.1 hypothetical protein SEA_AXUMITE_59 [Gordonia phage Axumite]